MSEPSDGSRRRRSSGCSRSAAVSSGTIASHRSRRRLDTDDRQLASIAAAAIADPESARRRRRARRVSRSAPTSSISSRAAVPWPAMMWDDRRRNQRLAAFGASRRIDGLAVFVVAVVEDHFTAVAFRRDPFHRRRIRRRR